MKKISAKSILLILMLIFIRVPLYYLIGTFLTNVLIVLVIIHFTFGIKKSFRIIITAIRYLFDVLLKVIEKSISYIVLIGILLAVIFLIFLGYTIYQQKSEIKDLTQKMSLVEKKLGGSEKLNCNEKDTIDKVRKSVVRVVGGEAEGSGFAIQEGGYILTNFHVIEFEPTPKVIFPDNTFETAEIIMADKNADLAVLKVSKNLPITTWGVPEKLNPAEELLAIGFPLGGQLIGEASVNKGALSARRVSKDVGVEYLQTDITLTPGVSGGPMVNICGEVEGINTAGLSGLGLAISSKSIIQKWFEMSDSKDSLKDIQKISFNDTESADFAVATFYNYLKARKLEKAFGLLSDNFKNGHGFDYWKQGYKSLLDTTIIKIDEDKNVKDRISIKFSTKDMVDGEIVYKYFEGYWDVHNINGKWRLWEPKIKEVKDPDYNWFYD